MLRAKNIGHLSAETCEGSVVLSQAVMCMTMQLGLERARADHLAAEASTQQAAATVREQLSSQLEQAQREVAVKQALCDGWQRANQVGVKHSRQGVTAL